MSVFFSILVPVYNVDKYIDECIMSVLKQQYTNYELLLIDDGSTDESGKICDKYAQSDARIKAYHKPNQGLLHTRRYGIDKASGDYYIFLDSDDMLKDGALEIIANKISQYKCDCIIYGYEKTENGVVISKTEDTEEICLSDKNKICKKCFFSVDMNSLCRKAVKATVFHDFDYSKYYGIQLSEDLLQSIEIYKNSQSIAFINEILYVYRTNPNSLTQKNDNIKIDFTVRKKVLEFIQQEQVFSSEDYDMYRDFCIELLVDLIIRISQSNNLTIQLDLFKKIRKDSYYQRFLKYGIKNRKQIGYYKFIIYEMFRIHMYRTIIYAVKLYMRMKL